MAARIRGIFRKTLENQVGRPSVKLSGAQAGIRGAEAYFIMMARPVKPPGTIFAGVKQRLADRAIRQVPARTKR
jgi:hypothetical protein